MKVHLGAWPLISAHDDNLLPMAIHERKYDFTKLSSSAIKKNKKKIDNNLEWSPSVSLHSPV